MPSTIFIVDDEKNIRRTVRMVLEGEGFNVEEASSGEEALARLPGVAADVLLLVRVTTAPPDGAGPVKVTVPVDEVPPITELGLRLTEVSAAAVTVRVAVFVTP